MRLSEKIRKLRNEQQLTQDDLAAKLFVSRQTISKWEQEISVPSLETLKELAVIFEVSLAELLDEDDFKHPTLDKYTKRNNILYYLNLFVVINIILMAFLLFRAVDDIIPAHYDLAGNVTRYGNKIEYLIIPASSVIFLPFSIYCHYRLANKDEYKQSVVWCQSVMLLFQLIILFATIFLGFKYITNIADYVVPLVTGLSLAFIFSVMFFSHPHFNRNKNMIYGVRTAFTLRNDVAWHKVNAFGSISGSIVIFIVYLITFLTFENWNVYLLAALAIALIPLFIYHEILRKKDNVLK